MKEVFHPPDHYCGSSLDLFLQVHVLSVLRTPEMSRVLQEDPMRVKGRIPSPALLGTLPLMQSRCDGFRGCKCTLWGFIQILIS